MIIKVKRYVHRSEFTIGKLYINGVFECFTLEDEKREVKVMHETRIPEGTYNITLRTYGRHHAIYKEKFPELHIGMLWIRNVPGFEDILIHTGNHDKHTSGCLLVGRVADEEKGTIYKSTEAYLNMYKKVRDALGKGEQVKITIE
jgi:hypothetical protein